MQKVLSEVPQFRSRGLCPVITRSPRGEKISRHPMLRVFCNVSIQFTQIAQSVVNIRIVEHFQQTHFASFHQHQNIVYLHLLLQVGW